MKIIKQKAKTNRRQVIVNLFRKISIKKISDTRSSHKNRIWMNVENCVVIDKGPNCSAW